MAWVLGTMVILAHQGLQKVEVGEFLTSVSKKPGQTIVLYYYCGFSSFFLKQTLLESEMMTFLET